MRDACSVHGTDKKYRTLVENVNTEVRLVHVA